MSELVLTEQEQRISRALEVARLSNLINIIHVPQSTDMPAGFEQYGFVMGEVVRQESPEIPDPRHSPEAYDPYAYYAWVSVQTDKDFEYPSTRDVLARPGTLRFTGGSEEVRRHLFGRGRMSLGSFQRQADIAPDTQSLFERDVSHMTALSAGIPTENKTSVEEENPDEVTEYHLAVAGFAKALLLPKYRPVLKNYPGLHPDIVPVYDLPLHPRTEDSYAFRDTSIADPELSRYAYVSLTYGDPIKVVALGAMSHGQMREAYDDTTRNWDARDHAKDLPYTQVNDSVPASQKNEMGKVIAAVANRLLAPQEN